MPFFYPLYEYGFTWFAYNSLQKFALNSCPKVIFIPFIYLHENINAYFIIMWITPTTAFTAIQTVGDNDFENIVASS